MNRFMILAAGAAMAVSGLANAGIVYDADWTGFQIRNTPTINYASPNMEFLIVNGGDKAGLGTNKVNGATIGAISQASVSRVDDYTRFTEGSGPYVAPYMNIWVKDAQGDYAVLANEPSNPEWTGQSEWNTSGANLLTKIAKVYEKEAAFNLPAPTGPGGQYLFSDFSGYVIEAPSVAKLTAGWVGLGGGAPREAASNTAYGFNWVFGDTLSNYVSGSPGYVVANPSVSAVPLPAAAWAGIALLGGMAGKKGLKKLRTQEV